MGRIRSGSGAGHVVRNEEHLQELCRLMADPNASVKQLNTLYAIRTAWASRGYLIDRELLIVRTDSSGEYTSKAAQRSAARETRLTSETLRMSDGVTYGNSPEAVTEVKPETLEDIDKSQVQKLGRKK